MSIVTESYAVSDSEAGFVRIDYSSLRSTPAGPHQFEASLWFERANLDWLVGALKSCVSTYGMPETSISHGHDTLRVYESGPEPAPYINIENERAAGSQHGGFHWFAMSKALAEQLANELAARSSRAKAGPVDTGAKLHPALPLVDVFERDDSDFDRALDELAHGFALIGRAMDALTKGEIALPQFASALAKGKQQIERGRSMLVLVNDEQRIARCIDGELMLIGRLVERLRDARADRATVLRLREEFLEHEPGERVAVTAGLHGASLLKQLIARIRGGTWGQEMALVLNEANGAIWIAQRHLTSDRGSYGPRFEAYLERRRRLADALRQSIDEQ